MDWTCKAGWINEKTIWRASGNTLVNASFEDSDTGIGRKLVVTGVLVDTLTQPSSDLSVNEAEFGGSAWNAYWFHLRQMGMSGYLAGDELWILYGARVPCLLRPRGSEYILVDVVEFHDGGVFNENGVAAEIVMSGDIIDAVERGEYRAVQVTLV